MDTFIYSLLRITIMVLIIRTMFRFFNYSRGTSFWSKLKGGKSAAPGNRDQESAAKPEPVDMVMDEIHNEPIPKHLAYIFVDDEDKPFYFRSWESRGKFIADKASG